MEQSSLSEALKFLRSFHGVNQSQLARELSISRSYLSEIESGRKQPSLELLKSYSTYFDVPLSSIMLFSETVESGPMAEKVRRASTAAALKLLRWVDERKGVQAA